MIDKRKIWGLCLTLGRSLSCQEIAHHTKIDLKKVKKHVRQLVKEKKLTGVRKFTAHKKDHLQGLAQTPSGLQLRFFPDRY